MGLSYFVGEVQSQSSAAVKLANEYIQHAGTLKDSVNHFLNAPLSSKTYDSARNYFRVVYPPLSNALTLAAESLNEAHTKYPAMYQALVGGGDTEEDRLLDQIQQGKQLRDSYLEVLDKLEKPNQRMEQACMRTQASIDKLQERLDKFYDFNSESAGIFSEAEANIANLEAAIAALGKGRAWNASSGTFDISRLDMTWVKPVQEKWSEREKKIQEKLSKNLLNYELRPTQGPNGTIIHQVWVNGELDTEATLQYQVYLALKKRQEIIENPITLEEKLLVAALFIGVAFVVGGSIVTVTGIKGMVDGIPVLALSNSGTAMLTQVVNVGAVAKVVEGFLITSAGTITIMASGNMLGENGPRIHSKTTWQNGKTERIDLENSNPGITEGNIHYHEPNNTKWYYDIDLGKFIGKDGKLAPSRIQKVLKNPEIKRAIEKALKYLGG